MTSTNPASDTPGPLILKTDGLGRVRTPAHKREALLDEFAKSGLSGAKFAALSGIKYQTLANWIQQRRRKGQNQPPSSSNSEPKADTLSWVEAVVQEACDQADPKCGSLTVHLPGGVRVEVRNTREATLAAALVRALQKPC